MICCCQHRHANSQHTATTLGTMHVKAARLQGFKKGPQNGVFGTRCQGERAQDKRCQLDRLFMKRCTLPMVVDSCWNKPGPEPSSLSFIASMSR